MGVLSGGWFLHRIGISIIHATLCFVREIETIIQTSASPRFVFGLYSVCIRFVFGLYSVCIRFVFGLYSVCIRFVFGLYSVCIRFVFGLYSVCISRTKQRLACIIHIYPLSILPHTPQLQVIVYTYCNQVLTG